MHLNKGNFPRAVTQVESLSLSAAPKQRQARVVKKQVVDCIDGFLRKKKSYNFIESEVCQLSIDSEYAVFGDPLSSSGL